MNPGPTVSPVAVIIHGPAAGAADTVRGLKAVSAGSPHTVYQVLDPSAPADALNRTAAVRAEGLLLFLDAGVAPTSRGWLAALMAAVEPADVGAAIGTFACAGGQPVAAVLTKRAVFDLLGGFDADRCATGGSTEDYLARLIGLGFDCVAPGGVEFQIAPPGLKRAG